MSGQKSAIKERLKRLVDSEICLAEDASKYALELRKIVEEAVDEKEVKWESRVFKALSDPTRLKILKLLDIREMCVCEIMVALDLTQPNASHHLNILENVGFVRERREGKWVFYSNANPDISSTLQRIKSLIG